MKIEVNKIMNPAFLFGTAFNIAYWHRKYHSGTICKGVSNPQTSKALSGCEKEEIPKWVWRRYRQRIRMKPKKSFWKMKGKELSGSSWKTFWLTLVFSWVLPLVLGLDAWVFSLHLQTYSLKGKDSYLTVTPKKKKEKISIRT